MSVKEKVKNVVNEVMNKGSYADDDNLIQNGMNSIDFIRIVVMLEEIFSIEVPDDKLLLENFSSIDQITNTIELLTIL